MMPELFSYKQVDDGYKFYVCEYSTEMGLALFDQNTEIQITNFGATLYKENGWVTENELPPLRTVKQAVKFLLTEEDIGLVDFEAELIGYGILSTHDDGECHFVMNEKQQCLELMERIIVPEYRDILIRKLLDSEGKYFLCTNTGIVEGYRTFDE